MEEYSNEIVHKDGNIFVQPNQDKVKEFAKYIYEYANPAGFITTCDVIATYVYVLVENAHGKMSKDALFEAISVGWESLDKHESTSNG